MWRLKNALALVAILSASLAHAEDSKQKSEADPRQAYYAFKKSFGFLPKRWRADYLKPTVALAPCYELESVYGIGPGPNDPVMNVMSGEAARIIHIRDVLRAAGYPEAIWGADLQAFENKSLEYSAAWAKQLDAGEPAPPDPSEPMLTALVSKLNAYQQKHPSLRKVKSTDEDCTGSSSALPVTIDTMPQAKRIQYISVHFVELCKEQGIDFLNQDDCNRWADYTDGTELAGKYKFLIWWTSQQHEDTTRDYDIDAIRPNRQGTKVITISK